jgi:hypothetical protein
MPRLLAAVWLAGLLVAGVARAEPLYVIEQLAVNVMSAPDASGERVATVKSGDRLEVLEREGDQVHVRLANGKDGWIRSSYLSAEEPLRARLAERDAEVARLKDQVSRLQALPGAGHAGSAGTASGAAGSAAAGPPGAGPPAAAAPAAAAPAAAGAGTPGKVAAGTKAAASAEPAAASGEDPGEPPTGLLGATAEDSPRRVWPWALGAALAGLGIGLLTGALVLDRHIRRKYGGLRIY